MNPEDQEKAESLLIQAVALSQPGSDITQRQQAAELYRQAGEMGYADAFFILGMMYHEGNLGEPDMQKAHEYLNKAANLNHADALCCLGHMYRQGDLGQPDMQKAREYYKKAADQDSVDALLFLGTMYYLGALGKRDMQKAHEYFEKAAGRDDNAAMFFLGLIFRNGELGAVDLDQAQTWFESAEQHGNPEAVLFKINPLIMKLKKELQDNGIEATQIALALDKLENVFFEQRKKHIESLAIISQKQKCSPAESSDKLSLSHFTCWSALESILAVDPKNENKTHSNCLRQYHVDYMNDPSEGRRLLNYQYSAKDVSEEHSEEAVKTAENISNRLKNLFDKHYHQSLRECANSAELLPSVFITSLTVDSDRLDLWRAYGRDGEGYCISFTVKAQQSDLHQILNRKNHAAFLAEAQQGNLFQILSSKNDAISLVEAKPDNKNNASKPNTPRQQTTPPLLYAVKYTNEEMIDTLLALGKPLKLLDRQTQYLRNNETPNLAHLRDQIDSCTAAILLELLYLYKDEQYSTEHEVRALQVLNINDDRVKSDERGPNSPGRLYVETNPFLFHSNTKIIVGPKVTDKQAAIWNLRWRLNKRGYAKKTCVEESKVKYR